MGGWGGAGNTPSQTGHRCAVRIAACSPTPAHRCARRWSPAAIHSGVGCDGAAPLASARLRLRGTTATCGRHCVVGVPGIRPAAAGTMPVSVLIGPPIGGRCTGAEADGLRATKAPAFASSRRLACSGCRPAAEMPPGICTASSRFHRARSGGQRGARGWLPAPGHPAVPPAEPMLAATTAKVAAGLTEPRPLPTRSFDSRLGTGGDAASPR